MQQPQRIEVGDTRQFTLVLSATPAGTPLFNLYVPNSVLVFSVQGTASGGGLFYTYFSLPVNSPNLFYAWTWISSFTTGLVVDRGLFQAVQTAPW